MVGVIGVEGRVESAVTVVQPSIKYPDYVHEPVGRGQEHGSGGLAQRQYSTVTGNVLSYECLLGGSDTSGPESLPSVQSLPSVPLGGRQSLPSVPLGGRQSRVTEDLILGSPVGSTGIRVPLAQ